MIGTKVKFKKDSRFIRGQVVEIFYSERTPVDEEPVIEGFGVSRKNKKEENYPHHKTEYVTFAKEVFPV